MDEGSNCLFAGLLITRQWSRAREDVGNLIAPTLDSSVPLSVQEKLIIDLHLKEKALASIDAFEKIIKEQSEPGPYKYCPDAVMHRFSGDAMQQIQYAKDDVRNEKYSAAYDALGEAL